MLEVGGSSLVRPPSRAGHPRPPPVSTTDQVSSSTCTPLQVFLGQVAETVGLFDLRKRSLPGRVWPTEGEARPLARREERRATAGGLPGLPGLVEGEEERLLWHHHTWRERVKVMKT